MAYVKNRPQLLAQGDISLRRTLLDIAEESLAAADPERAARRAVSLTGDTLVIKERRYDLSGGQRIFVIGAGKATFLIARVLDEILGDRIHQGLVVCKHGQTGALDHIALRHAAHPFPDEASKKGAEDTVALLGAVRPGDIVLACFTGGSSSLFVSPVSGITVEDKAIANRILLSCGANIVEINAVRKHLSRVKGGRLVRTLPAGAHLVNLTVSDVIADPLDYITDPSVPDTSSFADAQATLDKYGLWNRLPSCIVAHLRTTPSDAIAASVEALAHLDRQDVILVAGDAACRGAVAAARDRGISPILLSTFFEGESRELGRAMAAIAKQVRHDSPDNVPTLLIAGGETVVSIDGAAGRGGPNQEFAVSAAIELDGMARCVVLAIDTDGTDGPTALAGALVDGEVAMLARSIGEDLHRRLMSHDVTPALERLGCAVSTGATGTNVNDLKFILVASDARTEETCPL